jgi:hypothetical protein
MSEQGEQEAGRPVEPEAREEDILLQKANEEVNAMKKVTIETEGYDVDYAVVTEISPARIRARIEAAQRLAEDDPDCDGIVYRDAAAEVWQTRGLPEDDEEDEEDEAERNSLSEEEDEDHGKKWIFV